MCYCRGTIIPVHWENRAPSYYDLENNQSIYENYEMSFLAATFASAGYVVVAPDAIGYGATKDREHPYMHAASLGWTSLDMLRAAREFARQKRLDLDPRVFITGWSEGGLCGMALHKLIEDTCRDEFPVAASSLFAGCYALTAMIDLFCSYDEDFPEHQIYYWMLRSMIRVYGLERPFDRTVIPPFAAALTRDVLADAPKTPASASTPSSAGASSTAPRPRCAAHSRTTTATTGSRSPRSSCTTGRTTTSSPSSAQMAYEAMRAPRRPRDAVPVPRQGPLPAGQHLRDHVPGRLRQATITHNPPGALRGL